MAIRPIPKKLLPHTIEYKELAGSDGWDDKFKKPVNIYNVRVVVNESVRRTSNSNDKVERNMLYADRVHTSPYPDFKAKSKVVWNGKTYEITDVKRIIDTDPNIPHHYEMELV